MKRTPSGAAVTRPDGQVLQKARVPQHEGSLRLGHKLLVSGSLAIALTLAGCSGSTLAGKTTTACPRGDITNETLVITATATSAEPAPGLPTTVTDLLAAQGSGDHGCVVLVGPQGPARSLALTPRRGDRIEVGSRREPLRAGQLDLIETELAQLAATQPELDVLQALQRARSAAGAARHIVLITSGVNTTPPVNLGVVSWNEADIAAYFRHNRWVELSGFQVDLVGIGDVAGAQPPLDPPARDRLAALWIGVCRALGATARDLGSLPDRGVPRATAQVSVVMPPTSAPYVELDAATHFKRDLDQLASSADDLLHRVIEKVDGTALRLDITGHTDASTGTQAHNLELSRRRAEAVKGRLLQLGLSATNLGRVQGLGSAGFSVAQEQADRTLIAAHRTVRITFAGGEPT